MGTLHYAAIQTQDEQSEQWWTETVFYFYKDYELFSYLHKIKPGEADVFSSISRYECHHVQIFTPIEVEGFDFKYERDGERCNLFEIMRNVFRQFEPRKIRLVIWQDQ